MKLTKYRVLAPAALAALLALAPRSSGQEVRIAISTPNSTVPIGQPISLRIAITNVSGAKIGVERSTAKNQAELTYVIAMLDSQGRPVPKTANAKPGIVVSQVSLPLEPGQVLTEGTDLTRLFKIKEAGSYTVRVGRRWPPMKGKIEWSNTLTLTITN